MALNFAEIAIFAIPVVVVSASGVAGTSAVSCLISSSSGVVVSSAGSASLVRSWPGSSSIESGHVVGLAFCHGFFLSYFVNQGWTFALELPLGGGCYLVHLLDGDGILLLLSHH